MPNDAARWERVSALFAEASELPAGKVDAYLAKACADDDTLRAELQALLAVTGESERFFDSLADEAIPSALAALDGAGEEVSHAGRTYGQYRVVEEVGRGGMGVVYRAEDTRLQRSAALKFLPRVTQADRGARTRLIEEARAASMLDDPNICTIFGIEDTPGGETFIAMAFYDGETLAHRIERAPVPVGEGLAIAVGVARGLAAAHGRGITHRDLTPRNVMLASPHTVKILDFGLARGPGDGGGSGLGTPAYMPPEQVRGEAVGPAGDVWSLGVTLYELFTSRRPFEGSDTATILQAVLESAPRPPRQHNTKLPEPVERLILRMLQKEPAARPADAAEVVAALEPILARHRSRRTRLAVSGVVSLLGALVIVAFATRGAPAPPGSVPSARLILLPIAYDTTNANATYFAAGFHEAVSDELARISGIALISWTTAVPGENTPKARRRLGQALSAVGVLEGYLVGFDSVVLRLHDTKDDRVILTFGRNFRGAFTGDAERELALQVADALGVKRAGNDPALRRPGVFATDQRTGHVYEAVPITVTWFDAKAAAEARTYAGLTGHLATITSAEENEFIRRALPQAVAGRYWLGGFRAIRGGDRWLWVTGEPFTYTAWDRLEPNNTFGEDGLQYIPSGDSARWNDIDRMSGFQPFVHGFLVEYSPRSR